MTLRNNYPLKACLRPVYKKMLAGARFRVWGRGFKKMMSRLNKYWCAKMLIETANDAAHL